MSNGWKLLLGITFIGLLFWTGVGILIGLLLIAWYITSEREDIKQRRKMNEYYRHWYRNQHDP